MTTNKVDFGNYEKLFRHFGFGNDHLLRETISANMLSVTRKFFILKMNELEELKILKFVLRIFYHVILLKRMQRWGGRSNM